MNYQVYDLGQLKSGQRVKVTLSGNAANVRLMDSSNYFGKTTQNKREYVEKNVLFTVVNVGRHPRCRDLFYSRDFGEYRWDSKR